MSDDLQEQMDRFYFAHGPCCAGCDWWRPINSLVGECARSAPMSGKDRMAMIGIERSSLVIGAGHAITRKEHRCGDFKDEFDWSSLPLAYRKLVGAPLAPMTLPNRARRP
jgi:hypothetical protein